MADPYISEVKYLGGPSLDFVEVAVAAGTDVSNMSVTIYNSNGSVRSVSSLGSVVTTIAGRDVYVIDTATSGTFNGLHKFGGVALDDGGVVYQFVSFTDNAASITATGGAASGMTSTEIGSAGSGSSMETDDLGAGYFTQPAPNPGTIPCFVNGTAILTDRGERLIENIRVGDLVLTKDRGLQTVRWAGHCPIDSFEMADKNLQPIRIRANSFGLGLPIRDLLVSPNHRILLSGFACNLLFDQSEVLSAAKFLVEGFNITTHRLHHDICYHHLMFDQHEIIFSNGMETESFHTGTEGLNSFSDASRAEIFRLFPDLRTTQTSTSQLARMDLRRFEAKAITSFYV